MNFDIFKLKVFGAIDGYLPEVHCLEIKKRLDPIFKEYSQNHGKVKT